MIDGNIIVGHRVALKNYRTKIMNRVYSAHLGYFIAAYLVWP